MPTELLFKAMADATRQRLLRVLAVHELSVGDLVEILDQPQSTVSRHLKVLKDAELIIDRRCGSTVLYFAEPTNSVARHVPKPPSHNQMSMPTRKDGGMPPATTDHNGQSVTPADVRAQLLDWSRREALPEGIERRLQRVLRRRAGGSEFFETLGARWEQLRVESFGSAFHLEALTALLPAEWTVGDIGTGTGYLLPVLAARFKTVIAVEPAGAMLDAARNRPELKDVRNLVFRDGSLEELPIADGTLDLAIASLVLHHVGEPQAAVREIRRCLRAGGRLLVVEQAAHEHADFHERMGDRWWGFQAAELAAWVRQAGFADVRTSKLSAVQPTARYAGQVPDLFALTARVPEDRESG